MRGEREHKTTQDTPQHNMTQQGTIQDQSLHNTRQVITQHKTSRHRQDTTRNGENRHAKTMIT